MRQVRWCNYIEVAVISIVATIALTFLFGALGLTETRSYSEIAQRQFFGHSSFAETIGLYCIVSPVVEELLFRLGIFNLLLMIMNCFFNSNFRFTNTHVSSKSPLHFNPVNNHVIIPDNHDCHTIPMQPGFVQFIKLPSAIHIVVFITSLLFGIYHMNLVQGLYAFLMGLVITYCYAVYRKFSIPVIAHICANATALLITYFF